MRKEGKNNDEICRKTGCQFFGDGKADLVFFNIASNAEKTIAASKDMAEEDAKGSPAIGVVSPAPTLSTSCVADSKVVEMAGPSGDTNDGRI